MDFCRQFLNLIYSDGTSNLATRFRRLSSKRCSTKLSIWFVRTCISERITPSFCSFKLSHKLNLEETWDIRKKCLKKELSMHYKKLEITELKMQMVREQLGNSVHRSFYSEVEYEVETLRIHRTRILQDKIKRLKIERERQTSRKESEKLVSPFDFHPNTKNLSGIDFSEEEMEVIDQGLKHALPNHSNRYPELLAVEVDAILEGTNLKTKEKNDIRTECRTLLYKEKRKTLQKRKNQEADTLKRLKEKIQQNDLTVVKADKGSCTVVMTRTAYNNKVLEFIDDNGFKRLTTNPMTPLINKIKRYKVSEGFQEVFGTYSKLVNPNPKIPKLYGLPKIHKIDIPIRPVVSYVDTPTYGICKFLCTALKTLTGFKPEHSLKNSLELVESLRNLDIPDGAMLISLDAKNLYTSIPPKESVSIVKKELDNRDINQNLKEDIINLLNICLEQNFCQFQEIIYILEEGLPMGSPVSPLLSEFFMDHLEKILFNSKQNILRYIFRYYRYVDDIFIIFLGGRDLIMVLLNFFNSLHKNITFTLEIGPEKINFLDLTLTLRNNKIEVDIYRKETQTVNTIRATSNHPESQKQAAFNTYIHRLLNLPLSKVSFNKELNIIKYIAQENGFHPNMVDSLLYKKLLRLHQGRDEQVANKENKKYTLPMSFHGDISYKLRRIFEKNNYEIPLKAVNCLHQNICNYKDKTPILEKNGVYQLNCGTCDKFYIGKTFRSLNVRVSEHIRNYGGKSAFGNHLTEEGHGFNKDTDVRLVFNLGKGRKLDLFEMYEIAKAIKNGRDKCLNTQTDLHLSYHPIYESLI